MRSIKILFITIILAIILYVFRDSSHTWTALSYLFLGVVHLPPGIERRKINKKELFEFDLEKNAKIAKIELEELLHEKLLRKCKKDPNQFIEYTGSVNSRWLGQAMIHRKWNSAMKEHDYVLLICPREHGKTSQIVLRVIWELGKNPNLRIKLVCQNDDTAVKRLNAIIDNIENNKRVKEVFSHLIPATRGEWSKTKIYVQRSDVGLTDPSIEACGILSTGTGGRADLMIFDDPVDFRNAIQQPALRETVKEAYNNVWMNVAENDGRVWYIATLWHKDDLTHLLLTKKKYFKIFDAINKEMEPIWPEKWPKEALEDKLEEIGTRAFDRGFRNKALSDEDVLFPRELLERCFDKEFKFGGLPKDFVKEKVRYFGGIDIAAGKSRTKGAYSVMFTIAIYERIKVPISIIRGRFTSPQFTQLILDEINQYSHDLVYIENNAQQEALLQWIDEIALSTSDNEFKNLPPIRGFFTGMQKQDEGIGLPSISVEMEKGSWKIPDVSEHSSGCSCNLCVWINEMSEYPIGKYNDTVMTCWFAKEAARELMAKVPRVTLLNEDKPHSNVGIENAIAAAESDGGHEEDEEIVFRL
jgi:hypothetical protein